MILHVRKLVQFVFTVLLFLALTLLFYHFIGWGIDALSPRYPFKKPYGHSVEIFSPVPSDPQQMKARERLYYFWYHGEY